MVAVMIEPSTRDIFFIRKFRKYKAMTPEQLGIHINAVLLMVKNGILEEHYRAVYNKHPQHYRLTEEASAFMKLRILLIGEENHDY